MISNSYELPIYNCHIHIITNAYVPRHFLKMILGPVFGVIVSVLLRWRPLARILISVLKLLVPSSDQDALERYARFLENGMESSQAKVFERISRQYSKNWTFFIVLPMDMTFMKLGKLDKSINEQHEELLKLSQSPEGKQIIPFYAADPRWDDIVQRVKDNVGEGKFRGVKIYPNLGYMPDDPRLLEVYKICIERNVPVMAHCTPYGMYQYGFNLEDRVKFSHPESYERIYAHKELKELRLCLAHFGGDQEWERLLIGRNEIGQNPSWARVIADMIRSGDYPNLYTDISYTAFKPYRFGQTIDFYDYLNLLLQNELLRTHILFGSDYYMYDTYSRTEEEVKIAIHSRLGEKLFMQITYHNPRKFLGIK